MKRYTFHLLLLLSFVIILCSCQDKDNFSTDSSLKLTFASEKISFDTVFTELGSATHKFKIYNRNSKSVTIRSVRLLHAEKTGFSMNLDGEMGTNLQNVDILKKDSLYAFVKVKIDPLTSDNPTIIRDTIQFLTNGNVQNVYLEAIGQNVHIWHAKLIENDTILTDNKPFLIYDSLVVKANQKLTIKEGVKFYFRNNASLKVHGTIDAKGTIAKPIVMRGDRFDKVEGNILYDNMSGQWDGVYIFAESYNNHFENVHIRSNVNGLYFEEATPTNLKANLINTIVHNTANTGVTATNCQITATNCLFSNSKNSALSLLGGEYELLHCTIANYYRWSGRKGRALTIGNTSEDFIPYPLTKCNISNSIIDGSFKDDLSLRLVDNTAMNFKFKNCLIKSAIITAPQFENIIWNAKPLFKNIDQKKDYVYDFSLQFLSPAKDQADRNASLGVPTDIKGISRLNDSNPDIGCYEWIEE